MAIKDFEDIFKAEVCKSCGGLIKSAGKKGKGKGAKKLGNEEHPHRGPASGQVDHPRPGGKIGVERDAVKPKNPTVVKAMFPVSSGLAVAYSAGDDADLAKSVENTLKPGGSTDGMYVPPSRNLAAEQSASAIQKAMEDSSSEGEEEESGDEGGEESESDDGESSES